MATLRRVEKQGRLPTLDKLLWRWFPNASKIRQKLQAVGMNLTLGDFAFASIAIAVGVAFLLYLLLDLPPGMALGGSLLIGVGLPNLWSARRPRSAAAQFNLLFPEAVDLIVRALRAGLPVQEAIGNVARDIKDPVGGIFQRAQQEMQLGVPIEAALWRVAKTVQTDEFNFLIVALSIQRDTGGNLAETLANLSALLRARQQLRLKIRAFTSEARATMLIMAGLPFLVGGGAVPDFARSTSARCSPRRPARSTTRGRRRSRTPARSTTTSRPWPPAASCSASSTRPKWRRPTPPAASGSARTWPG